MKIVTTEDLDGMPAGSVVQDAEEITIGGVKYWRGTWSSMCGSYIVDIPDRVAKKHDDPSAMPAYKKLLELWKKK